MNKHDIYFISIYFNIQIKLKTTSSDVLWEVIFVNFLMFLNIFSYVTR